VQYMKPIVLNRVFMVLAIFAMVFAFGACEMLQPRDSQPSPSAVITDGDNDDNGSDKGKNDEAPAKTDNGDSDVESLKSLKSFFPIHLNSRLVYEGEGNEFAFFNAYTDYASDSRVQIRTDNGGTQSVRVVEIRDDAIVQILFRGEVYYRENHLNIEGDPEEVLLKAPLETGNAWTLSDGRTRKITGVGVDVGTPMGSYKAVEVTTEGEYGTNVDYYAEDVGLIKTVYKSEDAEVSSTLSKIEKDVPFVQSVNFYYPSVEDSSLLYYVSKEVSFNTNDITRMKLEKEYKEAYKEGGDKVSKVFSENTKINSLYLNKDGMVYIDLSKEYLTEMSAGAGYELAMLQSIANTFGQYYHVEKVLLTIDNELYSSGHIYLEKGEAISVNYEITKSVKE
jgi:hypothetical protein